MNEAISGIAFDLNKSSEKFIDTLPIFQKVIFVEGGAYSQMMRVVSH
jgi:hypothetical protein